MNDSTDIPTDSPRPSAGCGVGDAQQHSERSPFKTCWSSISARTPPLPGDRGGDAPYDLPNLQLAIDSYLERDGVSHRPSALVPPRARGDVARRLVHDSVRAGRRTRRRTVVPLDGDRSVTCVTQGSAPRRGRTTHAALISRESAASTRPARAWRSSPQSRRTASDFWQTYGADARAQRLPGKVLALKGGNEMMNGGIDRGVPGGRAGRTDQIVLPEGVLDRWSCTPSSSHGWRRRCVTRDTSPWSAAARPPGTASAEQSYFISQLDAGR